MWVGLGSILLNFALLTVVSYTFFTAYLNDMKTIVAIDLFGEAHLEVVLIIVLYLLLVLAMVYHIRKYKIRLRHS